MKAIFKTLKNFLVSATILCPTLTYAHDYDPAHWVAEINDTVRLCDLSIPEAHDAATWNAETRIDKDQEYSEKELFRKGVRAFDMRLGCNWMNGYVFSHGGLVQNSIETEIKYNFPDKSDLEGEFMVLFFQYEENDNDDDKKKSFQKFVDCLVEKYGLEDPLDNRDRFVTFSKHLTVSDVRGKIILVATGNDYNTNKLDHNKVPVALVHNGGKPDIYPEGYIEPFSPHVVDLDTCNWPQFFEQNCYESYLAEKKEKIKIGLEGDGNIEGWFPYLERTNNISHKFHKTQINAYHKSFGRGIETGYYICSDGFFSTGCNHYAYDLLNKYKGLPFGFVRFDYIGCGGFYYGDKLLDLIVDNNMHNSYYGNGGVKGQEDDMEAEIEDEAYNDETEVAEDVQPVIYNDGYMLYIENYGDNAVFNVYDMGRNIVAHSTTAPIEISHLKNGFYILEINGKGYKFVKK